MESLSQQQRNYAIGRINEVEKAALADLQIKHTSPVKSMNARDRAKAVVDGTVKPRRISYIYDYTSAVEIYGSDFFEEKQTVNTQALTKDTAEVREAARKARDEVMLGDAAAAKDLLAALDKTIAALLHRT